MSGIYLIELLNTGRFYVGSSSRLNQRLKEHFRELLAGKHTPKLQRAYDKYGPSAFVAGVLEEVPEENLTEREQFWIDWLDASRMGLNTSHASDCPMRGRRGDENPLFRRPKSIEHRLRIAASKRRYTPTIEHIAAARRGRTNYAVSLVTRLKLSEASAGKTKSFLTRYRMSLAAQKRARRLDGTWISSALVS